MFVPGSGLKWEPRQAIRGGAGAARCADYLRMGDMDGVVGCGRTELQPGSSVGEHAHPNTEELYLIVEGRGTGVLDGRRFPVEAGDAFVVKAGHSHGIENDSEGILTFVGLLTRQA